jgi:uncharacterized protein YndB with AHSA1/START domain
MTTVTVENYIAAPLEWAFEAFTDVEHAPDYVSSVRKIEMTTSGGFRLGTRWRETREIMGRIVTEEMEITAFERNHTYTITNGSHGTRMDTQFSFEPSNAGTKVSVEFTLDPQSFSARVLSPIGWALAGKIREAIVDDLEGLKRAAEIRVLRAAS